MSSQKGLALPGKKWGHGGRAKVVTG